MVFPAPMGKEQAMVTGGVRHMVCLLAAAALASAGCSITEPGKGRVLKDALVLSAAPLQVPAAGLRDSWRNIAREPWTGIPASPLVITSHLLKHTYASLLYAIDLPLTPVHVVAESEPIALYDTSRFPFALRSPSLERGAARALTCAR